MPTVAPIGYPIVRFVDRNGKSAANGKVYTYLAGSTTLAPTYTDATGAVPNPNPIALNSRGEAAILYDVSQTYKLVPIAADGTALPVQDNLAFPDSAQAGAALTSAAAALSKATASLLLQANQTTNTTFLGPEVGEVPVKLFDIIRGTVDPIRFGAAGDGVTNDAPAINAALATGKFVELRPLTYAVGASLEMAPGGGIIGQQEKSLLLRTFSGGQMVRYAGGTNVGTPITLRDFCINTKAGVTVANGDTGIDLGYSTAWVGRGDISTITIIGQWDGFKWKAGSVNPFYSIQVYEGMGHGFYGVNPRGELIDCQSESNAGNGYLIYAANIGETGCRLIHCGTFTNGGYGLILDTAAGVSGANIWADTFSSSADAAGGIYCAKPYAQLKFDNCFIETSGTAYVTQPQFARQSGATGLVLGVGVQQATITNMQILHCQGAGATIDNTIDVNIAGITLTDNGQGGQGGAAQNGMNIQNGNVRLHITGLTGSPAGSLQLNDIAINTANNTGLINGAFVHSFYAAPQTANGLRLANIAGVAMPNVAAASTLTLPVHADTILVNAAANINAITASWPDRMVRLIFDGVLTVANGNNLHLNGSPFTTAADSVLTLIAVGSEWFEVSRTSDR